jgi:hypothetical protein
MKHKSRRISSLYERTKLADWPPPNTQGPASLGSNWKLGGDLRLGWTAWHVTRVSKKVLGFGVQDREGERSHHHSSTMIRPTFVPRLGRSFRTFRRCLHQVPVLNHDFSADGVPGLLGPAGFDVAWTQYQSLMVEKLNTLTAGT